MLLNRAKRYYHENEEVLRKKQEIDIDDYQKKKMIRKGNMEERDIIMSEEDKQTLKEYQRNYRESKNSI